MNESNGQVATGSQNLRSMGYADAGTVFGKSDITHIVQAVFNAPVSTAQFQQLLRCRSSRWQNADEVNDFDGGFSFFSAGTGVLATWYVLSKIESREQPFSYRNHL
jgi:hypothetical protein